MTPFAAYGQYYDLFYRDKNYEKELDYIEGIIRETHSQVDTVLELGCGTGGHAFPLAARGYSVTGIDRSESMIKQANLIKADKPHGIVSKLEFIHADILGYSSSSEYSCVLSLFHVMSYMIRERDLKKAFQVAYSHVASSGFFIFDFWHKDGVMSEKPEYRKRIVENNFVTVTRESIPTLNLKEGIVDVLFKIVVTDKSNGRQTSFEELHSMRYFSTSEIRFLLESLGFNSVEFLGWQKKSSPNSNDWYGCCVAKK